MSFPRINDEVLIQTKIQQTGLVLTNLLTIVTSIGLIGVAYGQSFAVAVLFIYGGENFIKDGLSVLLLKWHSVAIILLAINGICEGFMFATMTSDELERYQYSLSADAHPTMTMINH